MYKGLFELTRGMRLTQWFMGLRIAIDLAMLEERVFCNMFGNILTFALLLAQRE